MVTLAIRGAEPLRLRWNGAPFRDGFGALRLALALCCAPVFAQAKIAAGDPLPPLSSFELEGEVPDLAGKVVLIDVWASWCAPCKASFPALAALQQEYGPQGFVVLAVSVDRRARDYAGFVQRFTPPFVTARDAAEKFATTFEPPAMPTSYLVDRHGRVREVHVGFHGERTVTELRSSIVALLEEEV